MVESITNPADIKKVNREKLITPWNDINSQELTPAEYFAALPSEVLKDFYEKKTIKALQIPAKTDFE